MDLYAIGIWYISSGDSTLLVKVCKGERTAGMSQHITPFKVQIHVSCFMLFSC